MAAFPIVELWHHPPSSPMAMRKLSWTLLLPFLLLFMQQAGWGHAYSHDRMHAASCEKAPVDIDHCLECLAYAQIGGVATPEAPIAALLSGLSFRFESHPEVASAQYSLISPRSRGPPVS